jgi:aldose 1-epimerase
VIPSARPPEIRTFTLWNRLGLSAVVTNYGATLMGLVCPDREGRPGDVVLGFDTVDEYRRRAELYFGSTVGRVANRIRGAQFALDGETFNLAANDGRNHLHGGVLRSLDRVIWTCDVPPGDPATARLSYVSPHLEEGYPGEVTFGVTYTLTDDGLRIDYAASCDRPTPISLSNHIYWDLAGAGNGDILDHVLSVASDAITPTDAELIPDGRIVAVEGTPLDLRHPTVIRDGIGELEGTPARGYDHNFVLAKTSGLRRAATVHDPRSGRFLEVSTTRPAIQIYTANLLSDVIGKGGATYPRFGGLCLEPQGFPDAVHHPAFPSVILRPGVMYAESTVFTLGTE